MGSRALLSSKPRRKECRALAASQALRLGLDFPSPLPPSPAPLLFWGHPKPPAPARRAGGMLRHSPGQLWAICSLGL